MIIERGCIWGACDKVTKVIVRPRGVSPLAFIAGYARALRETHERQITHLDRAHIDEFERAVERAAR